MSLFHVALSVVISDARSAWWIGGGLGIFAEVNRMINGNSASIASAPAIVLHILFIHVVMAVQLRPLYKFVSDYLTLRSIFLIVLSIWF